MAKEKGKKSRAIIERIERERGFVRLWPRLLAERDPDFMECLHNVTTHVLHRRNSLPRKTKEIILICLNAFSFYEFGFRVHVRSALKAGATEDELLEALEVVGVLNVHGMSSMLPALAEEVENYRKSGGRGRRRKKTLKIPRPNPSGQESDRAQ
ncbi:MAG: carboxymuconolactone decarboxylase family protein [Betaproteobacteria bacterium]|nr:carboxymuconolactone decarboxylase family protein [Betaproteobacteria bacterium]